jgi:hypothetical protein
MSDEFDPQVEIKKLTDKLEQTDKIAEMIIKAMAKSKDVDKAIKKIIIDLLKDDKNCRKEIEDIVKTFDRKEYKQFWKNTAGKIASGVWTLIVIIVTTIANKIIR